MGDHQQWVSVDECVAAYLSLSEQGVTKQFKLTHIAYDGMKQLGLDFFYTVKSLKLPINANLTVNLPDDCLMYKKVGVFNSRSEIIPLRYNSKLTLFADQLPTRAQQTEDSTLSVPLNPNATASCYYNYWDGYTFQATVYGAPSGAPFIGSFKIDNEGGVIVLSEWFSYPYIILEYIASPAPEQGTYFLPFQFKQALIAYIGWQDIQFMPTTRKGSLGDKQQRRRNYSLERQNAIARYKPLRLDDYYAEQVEAQRLTVKV